MSVSPSTGSDAVRHEPQPELVVVLAPDAASPRSASPPELLRLTAAPAPSELFDLLGQAGQPGAELQLRPVFGHRLNATAVASVDDDVVAPLGRYFLVEGAVDDPEELAGRLRELDTVEGAYVKPPVELPAVLNDMAPAADVPPARTPDFSGRQGYLAAPPAGVGAQWAHNQAGGRGANVNIIDIEGSWRFSHEDLLQHLGGLLGGSAPRTSAGATTAPRCWA